MHFIRYVVKFLYYGSKRALHKLRIPCLLAALVLWLLLITNFSVNEKRWSRHQRKSSIPLIIAWTKYFSQSISGEFLRTMDDCPYKCNLVERENMDPDEIPDAFIIHGRNLNLSDLPRRFPHQLVVLFLLEAPPYAGVDLLEAPPNYFNAIITYRKDATYYYPYGKFEKRDGFEDESRVINTEQLSAALAYKKNKAVVFVSHCDTHSKRETLIRAHIGTWSFFELYFDGEKDNDKGPCYLLDNSLKDIDNMIRNISEVMKITTVGECNELFPEATRLNCPRYDRCEEELIASHRFYLSFENSDCEDYITEKFFNRISQMLVPIVMNRTTYNAQDIPQDSFLAVSDYDSLKRMAEHVDFLMRNDSAYLEYFKWTKIYRKPNIFKSKVGCELCADLYAKRRMHIDDIREYYIFDKCDPDEYHLES